MTTDDCRACGLCCVSVYDQDVFCDVDEADCERLGVAWVRRNVLFPTLFEQLVGGVPPAIKTRMRVQRSGSMRGESACVCVALRGTLLKKVSCSVYDLRPQTCRESVKPGDPVCLDLRGKLCEPGIE